MTYDFHECLKFSHEAEDLPLWKEVYNKCFPSMVSMVSHRNDMTLQRQGVDRTVTLANGRMIMIDEKVRRRNRYTKKVYDDIALEYWSKEGTVRGWVNKPLLCEYIAYAIAPLGKCYLLPVLQLREAWRNNARSWLSNYPIIKSNNSGYRTVSVCVNANAVYRAIGSLLRVEFTKTEL